MAEVNEEYINKLYDTGLQQQKDDLQKDFQDSVEHLTGQSAAVQQQTDTHLERTDVEAQRQQDGFAAGSSGLSEGAKAQDALSRNNQKQQNVTTLRSAQAEAEAEIQRQRELRGQQFAAAIAQAQAENDLQRAQMLYDQAKTEEQEFLTLRQQAGELLASKGDDSILRALYGLPGGGAMPTPGTPGQSGELTVDEDSYLRQIYDAKQRAEEAALRGEYEKDMADLQAQQEARQKKTDEELTRTYTEAARAAKNDNEIQNAHGAASGTMGQARLARDNELLEDLTALRALQTGADAAYGAKAGNLADELAREITASRAENDRKLVQDIYDATRADRKQNLDLQLKAGQLLAQEGDYSLLGKLYGLTPEQIARLQGRTGKAGTPPVSEPQEQTEQQTGQQSTAYPAYGGNSGSGADLYYANLKPGTAGGNTGSGADSAVTLNMDSVRALGLENLSGEELAQLVNDGRLMTKLEGNKVVVYRP